MGKVPLTNHAVISGRANNITARFVHQIVRMSLWGTTAILHEIGCSRSVGRYLLAQAPYQRKRKQTKSLIEFGYVKRRVYRLTGWVWRSGPVNRRGFFLLSLFDRNRGSDYRRVQHSKIGKSASRAETWS